MIIFRPTDAKRIIDLFRQYCREFIFVGIPTVDHDIIMQHLDWMRAQSGNLNVCCRFETIEATQETKITITAGFVQQERGKPI